MSGKGHSPNFVCSSYVITDHDSANLQGASPLPLLSGQRRSLTTEVNKRIGRRRVAYDVAIVVDCDHGKILLSGVMKSTQDAKQTGDIAAGAPGVSAVKNQLTWH